MTTIQDIWLAAMAVSKAARRTINAQLRPLGLSSSEANILLHLAARGEAMTQEQVCELLDITKAATSRLAGSLEKKGYIVRERAKTDRRYHWLSLTDRACAAAPDISRIYDNVFDTVLTGVPPEALDALLSLLHRIMDNFQTTREGADDPC